MNSSSDAPLPTLNTVVFCTFPVCDRAELQGEGPRERGDMHDDVLR